MGSEPSVGQDCAQLDPRREVNGHQAVDGTRLCLDGGRRRRGGCGADTAYENGSDERTPGGLWIAALLSSLLALEFLFRDDAQDGTLEQFVLSGQSLTLLLLAKTVAHWLLTGLPLAVMAPFVGVALGVPMQALPGILAALALGTVTLSLIGAIGAGLTLGVRRGGVLLSLLTLPLAVPILIFGARATELAIKGADATGPLYLLAALAVFGLTLAPLAAAAAVRIGLE